MAIVYLVTEVENLHSLDYADLHPSTHPSRHAYNGEMDVWSVVEQ